MLKSKEMKVLAEVVFYTLLILLPVNISKHFFTDFSFVHGILVDYYLPTIYLTDLLIVFILLTWLVEFFSSFRPNRMSGGIFGNRINELVSETKDPLAELGMTDDIKGNFIFILRSRLRRLRSSAAEVPLTNYLYLTLFLFIIWSALSIFAAQDKAAAVYRFSRFLLYVLLALWMKTHLKMPRDFSKVKWALLIGLIFESALAVFQWFKGGSVFGFYFLGEPNFNGFISGIAKTGFLGEVRVRSYGTFSHPNVLGAYLSLLLPWLFLSFPWRSRFLRILTIALCLMALFFSFSRTAWAAAAVGVVLYFLLTRSRSEPKAFSLARFSLILIFLVFFLLSGNLNDPFSLSRRVELTSISTQMVRSSPIFGVGFGNFILKMDEFGRVSGWTRFLQPVHNIFLLVGTEVGTVGLGFFIAFFSLLFITLIFQLRKNLRFPSTVPVIGPAAGTLQLLIKRVNEDQQIVSRLLLVNLFQVFILGMADHFFLTTAQGSLLLWTLVGLVFLQVSN